MLQIWVCFDLCHFDLLKRGCANSVVGLELADLSERLSAGWPRFDSVTVWGSSPKGLNLKENPKTLEIFNLARKINLRNVISYLFLNSWPKQKCE